MNIFSKRKSIQIADFDCGYVSLEKLLKYYGINKSVFEMLLRFPCDKQGLSLKKIQLILFYYLGSNKIMRGSVSSLKELQLPTVLLLKKHHYVVLRRIKNHFVYLYDPKSGNRKFSIRKFESLWSDSSGLGLFIQLNDLKRKKLKRKRNLNQFFNFSITNCSFPSWFGSNYIVIKWIVLMRNIPILYRLVKYGSDSTHINCQAIFF